MEGGGETGSRETWALWGAGRVERGGVAAGSASHRSQALRLRRLASGPLLSNGHFALSVPEESQQCKISLQLCGSCLLAWEWGERWGGECLRHSRVLFLAAGGGGVGTRAGVRPLSSEKHSKACRCLPSRSHKGRPLGGWDSHQVLPAHEAVPSADVSPKDAGRSRSARGGWESIWQRGREEGGLPSQLW